MDFIVYACGIASYTIVTNWDVFYMNYPYFQRSTFSLLPMTLLRMLTQPYNCISSIKKCRRKAWTKFERLLKKCMNSDEKISGKYQTLKEKQPKTVLWHSYNLNCKHDCDWMINLFLQFWFDDAIFISAFGKYQTFKEKQQKTFPPAVLIG